MRNHSLPSIPGILLSCLFMAVLLASQAVLAQDKATSQTSAPAGKPSGKVTMTLGQGGLLLGASAGDGTLVFKNKSYPFELGGVGFGQFGGSRAVCEGEVYNLVHVDDFSGAYVQLKTGVTGTKGKGEIWLKNTKGVEIWLRSKTTGLELTAEAEGVLIKLKDPKRK